MAHELFGERFYGLRTPAWHGLGFVSPDPITAVQALDHIGGYDVSLVPMLLSDTGEPAGRSAIVRTATTDDPERRIFGYVSPDDYSLIGPRELAELWDINVASPVETLGALRTGETMFLTCRLPDFDVNGDEINNYMLVSHHMTGSAALQIRVTPIRVVCMNTLIAAKRASTETYRIVHNAELKDTLAEWLREVHDGAIERAAFLQEAFKAFADTRVSEAEAVQYVKAVYPDPKMPATRGPAEYVKRQAASYEYAMNYVNKSRDGAMALYGGMGKGMDSPACAGTLFGAYNAIVELEDYRRPAQGDEKNALYGALWGERAITKEEAFDKAVRFMQNGPDWLNVN